MRHVAACRLASFNIVLWLSYEKIREVRSICHIRSLRDTSGPGRLFQSMSQAATTPDVCAHLLFQCMLAVAES